MLNGAKRPAVKNIIGKLEMAGVSVAINESADFITLYDTLLSRLMSGEFKVANMDKTNLQKSVRKETVLSKGRKI